MLGSNMQNVLLKEMSRPWVQTLWPKGVSKIMSFLFWKEIMVMNHSKMPLPSSIDWVTGSESIAVLYRNHYSDIFNCFKSEEFNVGDVSNSVGVVIRPGEMCHWEIGSTKHVHTTEHLKYASHRVSVLLDVCFTGLLCHAIYAWHIVWLHVVCRILYVGWIFLPAWKITDQLLWLVHFPKYYNISWIDFKNISTDNQFGFKNKHGTDLCMWWGPSFLCWWLTCFVYL